MIQALRTGDRILVRTFHEAGEGEPLVECWHPAVVVEHEKGWWFRYLNPEISNLKWLLHMNIQWELDETTFRHYTI